jgi:hypothetical protein
MFHRHIVRTGAIALSLATFGLPAFAVGAKCPPDTPQADHEAVYSNKILRCERRDLAAPTCPVTHANYMVLNGWDICTTVNVLQPPPEGPLRANPICPPGMERKKDGGNGDRDICRGTGVTQVMPQLIPN